MAQPIWIDWLIVSLLFALILGIGLWASKKAGRSQGEFFLSGRKLPWWMLGTSMVATTFATDTPNLVTDIVRKNGIAGNWEWWAFLLTGMLTVFIYARLWRRSGVSTDMEFYELRYGGEAARFLRIFRAIYLGLFFNVLAMSAVTLAAIKIGEVMLGLEGWQTVSIGAIVTLVFSTLGGFRGVIYTDFVLFFVAMAGAITAAIVVVNLPEVGGLSSLLAHENVHTKLDLIPDVQAAFSAGGESLDFVIAIFIIPLAVQWWNAWYPGAEPGGGGYVAQRMLAAQDESHAMRATFFFNIMHYALRPWPWILVALASLVVFPQLSDLQAAFPNVPESILAHDLAYPAMLTFLPHGIMGLVLASLAAAFVSTLSTHLNWGASYLTNDVYKRFINPEASEKQLVSVGRIWTAILLLLGVGAAFSMRSAKDIFDIILMFGAGTGLIFLLRWFWWRINAWSEITAMFVSGIVSLAFAFGGMYPEAWPSWGKLPTVAAITTLAWLIVTFATAAEKPAVLQQFYRAIRPGGKGWQPVQQQLEAAGIQLSPVEGSITKGLLLMLLGTALVYSCLFATGYWIYGELVLALVMTSISTVLGVILWFSWKKE